LRAEKTAQQKYQAELAIGGLLFKTAAQSVSSTGRRGKLPKR